MLCAKSRQELCCVGGERYGRNEQETTKLLLAPPLNATLAVHLTQRIYTKLQLTKSTIKLPIHLHSILTQFYYLFHAAVSHGVFPY